MKELFAEIPELRGERILLRKNGFSLVVHAADEDWGYGGMTPTDKWIR